nr:dirigent protein 22-like [Ipomoea batatas]
MGKVNHGGLSGDDGALKFFEFGSLFVTDDPITEEFDSGSAVVARGQGLYVTSALDGKIAHVVISVVFTGGEFSGSTLQIQGASPQLEKVREVAVVGGTGIFRFAPGYATFETAGLLGSFHGKAAGIVVPEGAALLAAVLSGTDEPPRMEAMAAARAAGKLGSDVRAFTVSANSAGVLLLMHCLIFPNRARDEGRRIWSNVTVGKGAEAEIVAMPAGRKALARKLELFISAAIDAPSALGIDPERSILAAEEVVDAIAIAAGGSGKMAIPVAYVHIKIQVVGGGSHSSGGAIVLVSKEVHFTGDANCLAIIMMIGGAGDVDGELESRGRVVDRRVHLRGKWEG